MKALNCGFILFAFVIVIVAGCGGGGDDASPVTSGIDVAQGRFIDRPVQGLSFQSGKQAGVTGPNGEFTYEIGKTVVFYIGKIVLGQAMGKSIITPLDLASDGIRVNDGALNIARFLQSLDPDPTDGCIEIPVQVRESAQHPDIENLISAFNFSDTDVFNEKAGMLISHITQKSDRYRWVVTLLDGDTAGKQMQSYLSGMGIQIDLNPQGDQNSQQGLSFFTSPDTLESYLKEAIEQYQSRYRYPYYTPSGTEDTSNVSGGDEKQSFSTTNIQESGVDEADVIKTDGRYLYIAPWQASSEYGILDVKGRRDASSNGNNYQKIEIMELFSDSPASVSIGAIAVSGLENQISGLYLSSGKESNKPALLVAIAGNSRNIFFDWYNPWKWQSGRTEIVIFNVDSPAAAIEQVRLKLDGRLVSSRLIDDMLYVVTRFTPFISGYTTYPSSDREKDNNAQVLSRVSLTDLLPDMVINGTVTKKMVRPENCLIPPFDQQRIGQPDLVTITVIDLGSPEQPVSKTIVGPTETIYVSTDSLYLATTRYNYVLPGSVSGVDAAVTVPEIPPETTDIHKFALTTQGPVYRGSANVIGHLGWETDKKPFRMSEHDDVFRIATSLGRTWDETSRTRLTLLSESTDGKDTALLKEISFIDHIGKPGESLYSARFIGNRAFLVTFRVTDPLYAFDLSDPVNPIMAGELEIKGYSDYLHPVGENLLVGIGKDALPDTSASDFGGRGAWYQGLKLSLFDVSDLSRPSEINSLIIGKRGTESDILYDHHALAYLFQRDEHLARLAIPVRLHDSVPDNSSGFDPSVPWAYYSWTHTGLYLFDIDTGENPDRAAGIKNIGKLIVESRSTGQTESYRSSNLDRSVILEDSVHYVHDGKVWSQEWPVQ